MWVRMEFCDLTPNGFIDPPYPGFERSHRVVRSERPPNGLRRLEERLTKVAKFPSFPAYLRANFEAFSKTIGRGGPDKWTDIAAWALEEGLTGGKSITAGGAKRAFEREKARRARLIGPAAPVTPAGDKHAQRAPAMMPERETELPAPAPSSDARARFREKFLKARIRKKPEE
jgi:hypothetical protein